MSQPTLGSTPIGTNTTNGKTSPIDLIPVGTKMSETMQLTRPTKLSEKNGKAHVPDDPDPGSLLSDSSLKKKKHDKKKKRHKHKKDDLSDPSSSDDSDLSYDSDYRYNRRKRKIDMKKDPINYAHV